MPDMLNPKWLGGLFYLDLMPVLLNPKTLSAGGSGLEIDAAFLASIVIHCDCSHPLMSRYCGFTSGDGTMNEISNSLILSHWGLTDYEAAYCTAEERLENRCSLSTLHPCFDPTKDVVIPSPQR